jgi:predicted esterase
MCVLLHGSGSSESGHGRMAGPLGRDDVIYVVPRSLHPHVGVFTGAKRPGWTVYPPEWDHAKDYEPGLDPLDLHTDWIARCVADAQRRYRNQSYRVFVWGHSQGAAAAHHFALRYPERVASFCAYAGYYPLPYDTKSALRRMKDHGVRAYYGHGKADRVVAAKETIEVVQRLQGAGMDPSVIWFEGGHGLLPEVITWSRAWADSQIRNQKAAAQASAD